MGKIDSRSVHEQEYKFHYVGPTKTICIDLNNTYSDRTREEVSGRNQVIRVRSKQPYLSIGNGSSTKNYIARKLYRQQSPFVE